MSYSKIKQWDTLASDFARIGNDEELLITLGKRKYIVKVATDKDLKNHNQVSENEEK